MIMSMTAGRRAVATATVPLLALTLLTAGAATAAPASGPPQTVIVEFEATPTIAAAPGPGTVDAQSADRVRQARAAVDGVEHGVTEAARRARITLTHRRSYHVLLPGMAVEVPAGQVDALRRLPGVKSVHGVQTFQIHAVDGAPANLRTGPGGGAAAPLDSVPLIGAPQVWQRKDPAGRPVRGAGVTVAVIDTGIDYRHPALGGGFGPGYKVAGGYDFVNDDADPADDNAHGTHVAGIIAGTGAGGPMAVTGVAPDATLTAYKVFDAGGSGTDEDILAGIEAAVDPANPNRADVINMSFGGQGDGTDPIGQAATRAAQAGVVVVAAAGNSGPGERTIGSPAAADGVIAVGASTSGLRQPVAHLASPVRERVEAIRNPSSANPPARPVTGDVVDLGEGTPDDLARAGDIRGKVVLLAGVVNFDVDLLMEAERRGAIAAIRYNPGVDLGPMEPGVLPAKASTTLGAEDDLRFDRLVILDSFDPNQYLQFHTLLAAGRTRITISGEDATDEIADFSSRGPGPRWQLKPEIVAPGVEIRSSVPTDLWASGVFRLSGTSMAAPHVAGAAALLRQLRPELPAPRVAAALIGSARAVPNGPAVAGAGRLDVASAVGAVVTADPPALSFGLADLSRDQVRATRTVALRNDGDEPQRLRLGITPAAGSPGTAQVEPSTVTVAAGGRATVTVRITTTGPDQGSGDVSGWLTVDAPEGTPDLRVPYLLAVRTPEVYVSPDPSDGHTEVFTYTLESAAAAPTVTIRSLSGQQTAVTMQADHDLWWRAPVIGSEPGVHTATVTVPTASGPTLVGRTTFDVAEPQGDSRWELVGPNSTGGTVSTTAADPNRLVVAPSYTAGIWLTTDHARTWRYERLTPVAGTASQPKVLIDQKRADRMWVAVNNWDTYHGRVLRTDDAGRTWQTLSFPDAWVDGFAQDPSGTLVAVTGDTLRTSRDGGETWTATAAPWTGGVWGTEFAGEDLYVATDDGIWRWAGLSGVPQLVRAVGDYTTWPRSLAVVGETVVVGQIDDSVWGTTDSGRNWQRMTAVDNLAAVSGTGDTLLADGSDEAQLSRDRGRTWSRVEKPVHATTYDVAQWPGDDRTLLLGMEGVGVYATGDAKTFTRVGVPGQSVNELAVTDEKLLAGTDVDLYSAQLPADPAQLDWGASGAEGQAGLTVSGLAVSPSDPRTVWKLYRDALSLGRLVRSRDAGATWSDVVQLDGTPLGLAVHPADPRQIFIPYVDLRGRGLFVSRDGGTSWKKIDHKALYSAVAGDPGDARRVWLGDEDGLWRSDDGGATRVKVLDGPVTALSVDKRRIVVGGAEIRVSTDGGRTFTAAHQLGAGRDGLPIQVSQIVASGDNLYAGTGAYSPAGLIRGGRGVLRSTDGGRTWVNIGAGLPDPSVRALVTSPDGRWLYAGTGSGGVYRLPIRD